MITLTPLSASASSSSNSEPICYLLELDDALVLLDVGQADYRASLHKQDWSYEAKLKEIAPRVSLVLLSHSPSSYLGLYPYARAHWGLTCPVYATQPTVEMGRVVCLSEAESWRAEVKIEGDAKPSGTEGKEQENGEGSSKTESMQHGPFVPTVEQIHEAFDWIKAIRYNQPLHLGGELAHLLLTPFPSGHTLGGTLFKIRSPTSGTVVYATGINHTGERHLDGMVGGQGGAMGYDEGLIRPDLLIVEAGRATVTNPKRREREKAVIDVVTNTLQQSKSVLIPTDPSPRLLELLVLLDQHWTYKLSGQQKRRAEEAWPYPLCLVSRTGHDMVNFAKSLIEWFGGVVRDNATGEDILAVAAGRKGKRRAGHDQSDQGALEFRHVKFFASPTDLLQAFPMNRPKVVLAIPPSMSHGPSRWLFTAMAAADGNVILLTSCGEDGTLTRELYDIWAAQQNDDAGWGKGVIGNPAMMTGQKQVELNSKVPLSGAELEQHFEAERLQKEREAANQAATERSRRMLEADDLDSDSDSDSEDENAVEDGITLPRAVAGANDYTGRAGEGEDARQMSFDIYVKGQQTRIGRMGRSQDGGMARFRMFPYIEKRSRRIDDYGEGLDIGQWVRKGREIAEEGETEEVREAKRRQAEEDERKKAPPEPPSKFIVEKADVQMKASLYYVDMQGLHDGQAIKTIIADLQPRKLILVKSSKESSDDLASHFAPTIGSAYIFAPPLNETIRIGEHVQSYSLMLGDSISSGLSSKWAKFEGYEVAMVDGRFSLGAGSTIPKLELKSVKLDLPSKTAAADELSTTTFTTSSNNNNVKSEPEPAAAVSEDVVMSGESEIQIKADPDAPAPEPPIANPKPQPNALQTLDLPSSLFVGDLRLAFLKSRLNSINIPAEFAGEGVLVCGPGVKAQMDGEPVKAGSIIAVRKLKEGEVVVEGSVGKVYWNVRKEVYKSLALVGVA